MSSSSMKHRLPEIVRSHFGEVRATVALGIPLVMIELAYMAIVTTDVIMIGWLGPESLAAGSLGGHYYAFFEYFAFGVLGAMSPMLAQHLGARRFRMIRRTMRQGFWASLILSVPCIAAIWHVESVLVLLGQDPELAAVSATYLQVMVIAFLPSLWATMLSDFLAAHERPRATLVVVVLGIGVNALANYLLIFGNFGFPRLEIVGAGVASAIVATFMFLGLLVFILTDRRFRRYRLLGRFWRADWPQLFEIVRIGVPIAIMSLAEISMFLASALLMGMLGTMTLAAHAIAIQCASITFMVPMGIGQAATVRVGHAAGAGNRHGAIRAGWTAMAIAVGFAVLPASIFWFAGESIADIFLDFSQPGVVETAALAVNFLAIAAVFQFADAVHETAIGALRGLKDTRGPMIIAVFGYCGLGLTLAAVFGVYLDLGGEAIWMCLAVTLSLVSVLLVRRFRIQSRRLATHQLEADNASVEGTLGSTPQP